MLTQLALIWGSYHTNRQESTLIQTCGADVVKECGPASHRVVHRDGHVHQHAYVYHGEHLEGLLSSAVQGGRDIQRRHGSIDTETSSNIRVIASQNGSKRNFLSFLRKIQWGTLKAIATRYLYLSHFFSSVSWHSLEKSVYL